MNRAKHSWVTLGGRKNHVADMATRSYIASRCALEQPQGGTDFRQAAPGGIGGLLLGALRVGFGDGSFSEDAAGVLTAVWNGAPSWRFQTCMGCQQGLHLNNGGRNLDECEVGGDVSRCVR